MISKTVRFVVAAAVGCSFAQSVSASPVTGDVTYTLSLSGPLVGSGTLEITDGPVPTGPTSTLSPPTNDITTLTITITEGSKQFQFNLLNSNFNGLEFQGGALWDITAGPVVIGSASLSINGTTATFFDSATQVSAIETVTATIAPVPEPSTWAMLLLGFAGLGLMASRRRRVLQSA
jgi:hypothetical protein